MITILNILAGVLLLNDFLAYMFRGEVGTLNFIIVRLCNGVVFALTSAIIFVYTMFVSFELFGHYGLSHKIPAKFRVRLCYVLGVIGMIMVIISQFTDLYYYFDANNWYHRNEPYYYISVVIPSISMAIMMTVLLQFRKNVNLIKWFILSSYIILPGIAFIIQANSYGYSIFNIAIGFSFIMMFIESVVAQGKEVMRVARTEVRTGLLNEHGCVEQFNSMRNNPEMLEYASVFIDIEKFTSVNRKFGMDAGNRVLVGYAAILLDNMEKDEFLGRQGSDLFIAGVKKKNLSKILTLLEGATVKFNLNKNPDENPEMAEVRLSSIAGVFEIDETDISGEDIISNAYLALTHAKTVSKKPVAFLTKEMRDQIDEKRLFEIRLPKALENREFVAYYQPKVNVKTRKLCGAEALARWIHNGTMISPGKFVPMMEVNDSICELDFCMLRKVCEDLNEWIEQRLDPAPVSINFSRRNLSNPQLAEDIDRIVCSFRIPKRLIEIEITETNDEFPISVLKSFVKEIRKLGYRTAVDDFGCGSSSLSVLREITFDVLKIDKGFIDNAYARDLTILSYIIKMSKAIGLEIVAEGVEQKDQIGTLATLGADVIQGYYFDRPLSKETMQMRLENRVYEEVPEN
ncbi:MAG: EAL domain-containing protein [Lachnospiraceae bacterium]|nr:EAL domain-containing protein [Lachnospiraceae bacterium]